MPVAVHCMGVCLCVCVRACVCVCVCVFVCAHIVHTHTYIGSLNALCLSGSVCSPRTIKYS